MSDIAATRDTSPSILTSTDSDLAQEVESNTVKYNKDFERTSGDEDEEINHEIHEKDLERGQETLQRNSEGSIDPNLVSLWHLGC